MSGSEAMPTQRGSLFPPASKSLTLNSSIGVGHSKRQHSYPSPNLAAHRPKLLTDFPILAIPFVYAIQINAPTGLDPSSSGSMNRRAVHHQNIVVGSIWQNADGRSDVMAASADIDHRIAVLPISDNIGRRNRTMNPDKQDCTDGDHHVFQEATHSLSLAPIIRNEMTELEPVLAKGPALP